MITSTYRRVAALSMAPLAAGAIFAASAAPAFAAPSSSAPAAAAPAPAAGSLTTAVTGLVNGVATTGTLTITQFVRQAGQILAVGNLNLGGQDLGQVSVPVNTAGTAAAAAAAPGSCSILHLDLGPLDLNLLGLVVHLDEVVLDISAQPGSGNLLGNLLCAVAGLLDNSGNPLGGITALLNNILGVLGTL